MFFRKKKKKDKSKNKNEKINIEESQDKINHGKYWASIILVNEYVHYNIMDLKKI